jgi:hypothetical protein
MFEARGTQDGDPLADAVPGLPPEEGLPGAVPGWDEPGWGEPEWGDPEWDEFVATVLAGDDTLTAAEVQEALARGFVDEDDLDGLAFEEGKDNNPRDDNRRDENRSAEPADPSAPITLTTTDPTTTAEDIPAPSTPTDPPLANALLADLDDETLLTDLATAHRAIATAQAHRAAVITELALRRTKDAVTELTGRKARPQEALPLAARALDEEVSRPIPSGQWPPSRIGGEPIGVM